MFSRLLENLVFINFISFYIKAYLIRYPAPKNIGYLWNYGVLSIVFFFVQIITGIFLAMFYTPHIDYAFISVDYLMSNISYGWLIRYLHANGASFFFLVVYIHILRGLYYNSYQFPRTNLWISGITIYFLLMATAFLGYVLPWGQMSFWAATVITNLLTVFPYIGEELVYWIWGGYSINNATLNRFFCLHFLLPFIIILLVVIHLVLLHQVGSTSELRLKNSFTIKISFFPYFIIKDLLMISMSFIFFFLVVFFLPELFNHSINYVQANPLVTPSHIVPEWYFLPFYAILRSILNKTFGIIAMFLSMTILYLLPILDSGYGFILIYNSFHSIWFFFFSFNIVFLGFLGSQTAEYPCVELGLFLTVLHILYCIVVKGFFTDFSRLVYKMEVHLKTDVPVLPPNACPSNQPVYSRCTEKRRKKNINLYLRSFITTENDK